MWTRIRQSRARRAAIQAFAARRAGRAGLLVAGLLSLVPAARAYTPAAGWLPTDLTMEMTLASAPAQDKFTRFLTFVHQAGKQKSVAVGFSRSSDLLYVGKVTADGLATLQSLVEYNNRSYWDEMLFVNKGGTAALAIRSLRIEIEYGNDTTGGREKAATIGLIFDRTLAAGYSSVRVLANLGRMSYTIDHFGWDVDDFAALPDAAKAFIYDIGKSGSSGAEDSGSAENPKYGLDAAMCSETISWYYYTYGEWVEDTVTHTTYDFRDTGVHSQMHDAFRDADRLYAYHAGRHQWIKKDRDYNWVYTDTYEPQPGDYLDRRDSDPNDGGDDGHAMMVVWWEGYNAGTGKAYVHVLDGPFSINFTRLDIQGMEDAGWDFCVGRIPSNDP